MEIERVRHEHNRMVCLNGAGKVNQCILLLERRLQRDHIVTGASGGRKKGSSISSDKYRQATLSPQ